jgi:peptidoglycan/LPS O-acetylase OafA/YrhL
MLARSLATEPPSIPTTPRPLTGRIPELDGVRGLAILLVLVFHWAAFQPAPHSFAYYLMVPRNLMWSGVDLFFVLSGFLIGGGLIDNRASPNYFSTFYRRRIYRIFPFYYLMVGLFLIGSFVLPAAFLFTGAIPRWPFLLFVQNIGFAIPLAAPWLGVTWSLAVEEQFYLLFPFAVRGLSRKPVLIAVLGCIAGEAARWAQPCAC